MNLLYLSRDDVQSLGLPMEDIICALEEVFVEKGVGRVEMPPKPGIHPMPDAFIHAMPAFVPKTGAAGVKWVSGFPQNMARGMPYISGLLILNDPDTGVPICIMDCTWITAKRTGAATAVAAKRLARPDSGCVAILGCGVQGRSNLEALKAVFPGIRRVQAYDVNRAAAEAFCAESKTSTGCEALLCTQPRQACADADIIVTAGPILKDPDPVIRRSWIKPGTFLSPVDFDSYLAPDVFAAASRVVTDDMAQQEYYRKIGYFQNIRQPDGDLGQLLTGTIAGRTNADEITIALNLGIALEDMATAVLAYRAAERKGAGIVLPL